MFSSNKDAFRLGIARIFRENHEYPTAELEKQGYPFLQYPISGRRIFFRSEADKKEFLDFFEKEKPFKHPWEIEQLFKGLPPDAAKEYPVLLGKTDLYVSVNYYGMTFICRPEKVQENVEWLLQHHPIPEWMHVIFEANGEKIAVYDTHLPADADHGKRKGCWVDYDIYVSMTPQPGGSST